MASNNKTKRLACMFASCALVCSSIMWLSSCAPQAPSGSEERKTGQQASLDTSWATDSDCTQCHDNEANSLTDETRLVATHSKENVTCIDCHTDESALSVVHEEAAANQSMPSKLKKTEVSEEACTPCHGSYEELAASTPDAFIVDDRGSSVNPHETPNLTEGHEGNLTCASCHSMHSASDAATNAHNACLSCHHEDVFECGTCH